MTLYYEEEGELKLSLPCEELARTVIEAALDDCLLYTSDAADE